MKGGPTFAQFNNWMKLLSVISTNSGAGQRSLAFALKIFGGIVVVRVDGLIALSP